MYAAVAASTPRELRHEGNANSTHLRRMIASQVAASPAAKQKDERHTASLSGLLQHTPKLPVAPG
jgi:hypothetical protein